VDLFSFAGIYLIVILGVIIGLVLGSFAKALADRSLENKSYWGRSYCPKCKHKLRAYDLFPILSYLFLKGKCRYCHKKIDKSYFWIEVIQGVLIGYLFYISAAQTPLLSDQPALILFILILLFKTFFITILVIITLTDLKNYFIPDRVIIPSIIIGFFFLLSINLYRVFHLYYYLSQNDFGKYLLRPDNNYFLDHVFMIFKSFGFNILTALGLGMFFFILIVATRGKGMGGGDLKLGIFIGLMLGFPNGVLAIMLGFFVGAIISILLIIFGKKSFKEIIPFGPFLVIGSLISLFWGDQIINWYIFLNH
jgi:prepilin signal peptidase PulO-like enzyme (type II secretory pathway)